ncbi:MAG: hypothetical protein ACOYI9_11525, partial [Candidatus Hydrogenedentales bacterium]
MLKSTPGGGICPKSGGAWWSMVEQHFFISTTLSSNVIRSISHSGGAWWSIFLSLRVRNQNK